MAKATTVAFACRVVPEAAAALRRAVALTGWSQAQLIESMVLNLQAGWLERFSAEERSRYESCAMNRAEFTEIRRRPAPPVPSLGGGALSKMAKPAAGSGAAPLEQFAMAGDVAPSIQPTTTPSDTNGPVRFGQAFEDDAA